MQNFEEDFFSYKICHIYVYAHILPASSSQQFTVFPREINKVGYHILMMMIVVVIISINKKNVYSNQSGMESESFIWENP